ncbi:hypothetical protein [Actinoplanes solisilvae]|uniref:hypothetical protein n=1 Tax=Actinoplanes solisilvae TaxID=2486853 RepID=UPI000FD82EFC|nr:hypothetical protein [Actinoplanes solisilvae]
MADIEAARSVRTYRVDVLGAAAVVLTVDAVLLLVTSVVGVPFLLFLFGDEDGTWRHLWPLTVSWLVAVVLAAVSIAAAARLAGFGDYSIRRVGTAAALGTGVAAAVLAATTALSSPGWLLLSLPLTVANLAAALVLAGPDRADAVAERFPLFRAAVPTDTDAGATAPAPPYADEEVAYARPAAGEQPTRTHDTVDLLAFYGPPGAKRTLRRPTSPAQFSPRTRLRAQAALRSHAGTKLPRRPRRPAE